MAAVACKRVRQLTAIGGFGVSKVPSNSFESAITFDPFSASFPSVSGIRRLSQQQLVKSNGKHLFLVDTLALVISHTSLSLSLSSSFFAHFFIFVLFYFLSFMVAIL